MNELIFQSTGLVLYCSIVAFAFGAVFGSFINCMSWRIVAGESVLKGRSHCASCNHPLGAGDLVPVFSYLFLKGKCRYCGERISPRYVIAELIMGTAFTACFLKWGVSVEFFRYIILCCILMGLSLVDLDTYLIPNRFILSGILLWTVTAILIGLRDAAADAGTLSGAALLTAIGSQLLRGLIGGLAIGGGILILSLIFDKVSGKEGMGGGDIKLLFVTGLFLGLAGGFLCLMVACVIGLLFVAAMKNQKIPFGPSISIACILCALFGEAVIRWYLNLL